MKALLLSLSFIIVAGYFAAEIAESVGAPLPVAINAANAVAAFALVAVLALLVGDYERTPRLQPVPTPHPVAATLPTMTAARSPAYSIRRGAEAARLATPPPVVAFRRTPHVRYERPV